MGFITIKRTTIPFKESMFGSLFLSLKHANPRFSKHENDTSRMMERKQRSSCLKKKTPKTFQRTWQQPTKADVIPKRVENHVNLRVFPWPLPTGNKRDY